MKYAMDFKNWKIKERLELLDEALIEFTFDSERKMIDAPHSLSSGQDRVLQFVRNPATPLPMHELSSNLILKALPVFSAFWKDYAEGRL